MTNNTNNANTNTNNGEKIELTDIQKALLERISAATKKKTVARKSGAVRGETDQERAKKAFAAGKIYISVRNHYVGKCVDTFIWMPKEDGGFKEKQRQLNATMIEAYQGMAADGLVEFSTEAGKIFAADTVEEISANADRFLVSEYAKKHDTSLEKAAELMLDLTEEEAAEFAKDMADKTVKEMTATAA